MNLEAIFHRAKSNYAYNYDGNTLHIIIRSKKNDIDKVHLICGDSSEFKNQEWIHEKVPMSIVGTGSLFDYWKIEYTPKFKRIRYCFEIIKGDNSIFYTEKGFMKNLITNDVNYYFCFPYIHDCEVFSAPEWVKDTVWYQIFPERFSNGDESLNPINTVPWRSEAPSYNNYFGGDFVGIIDQLDYLTDLGITGIYLTPIFEANTNHKYDTKNYMEIDPQFGDKKTFKKLINKCHERGIRVVLDAVFNHSGFYFPPFQDLLERGESSSYKDWFFVRENATVKGKSLSYDTFGFEPTMPKINTNNKEASEYLLDVARYWTKEFDIDGWRLDVASEVDPIFWENFRKVVKEINPDAYILGEVWHDAQPWLSGDKFDAVMNYPYTYAVIDYFAKEKISLMEFKETILDTLLLYSDNVNEAQFNLLDSHDTARTLQLVNQDKTQLKMMYFFHFTFVGTPCIYYGTEIGMTGEHDPYNRECMIWEKAEQDLELLEYFKKLIYLRKEKKALKSKGSFRFLDKYCTQNILVYERILNSEKIICIMNTKDIDTKLQIEELNGKKVKELLSNSRHSCDNKGEILIKANSCVALEWDE